MWEAAFYTWKAKFGGMTVSDAKLVNGFHRHEAQSNADNHHHRVCGLFGRIKRVTILNFITKARRSGGDEEIRISADIAPINYIINAESSFLGFSMRSECVAKCVAGNCPAIPSGNQKKRWHEWQD